MDRLKQRISKDALNCPILTKATRWSIDIVLGEKEEYCSNHLSISNRPCEEDFLVPLGSISKTLLAQAIFESEVEVSAPISKYLDFKQGAQAFSGIKVVDLLTHTSGLPRDSSLRYWEKMEFPTEDGIFEEICQLRWDKSLYGLYKYSNVNYLILARLLGSVSSQSPSDALNDFCRIRLGISDPVFDLNRVDGFSQVGSEKIYRAFPDLQAFRPIGGAVVKRSDIYKLMTFFNENVPGLNTIDASSPLGVWSVDNEGKMSGLAWRLVSINSRVLATHSGGLPGFCSSIIVDVKNKSSVLISANTDGILFPTALKILEILVDDNKATKISQSYLHHLPGKYQWLDKSTIINIKAQGRELIAEGFSLPPLFDQLKIQQVNHSLVVRGGLNNGESVRVVWDADLVKELWLGPMRLTRLGYQE